jgi:uncharacterized heparinase superfamily protein
MWGLVLASSFVRRRIFLSIRASLRRRLQRAVAGFRSGGFDSSAMADLGSAPRSVLPTNPALTKEFYSGRFTLSGITVDSFGASPFEIEDAPMQWQIRLHAFSWLRHLLASDTTLSQQFARSLFEEWLERFSTSKEPPAWKMAVASERMFSCLTHAALLMRDASEEVHMRLLGMLGRHHKFLKANLDVRSYDMEHLLAALALAHSAHIFDRPKRVRDAALRNLDRLLTLQMMPQGHISRKPSASADLMPMMMGTRNAIARQNEFDRDFSAKTEDGQADVSDPVPIIVKLDAAVQALARVSTHLSHSGGILASFNGAHEDEIGRVAGLIDTVEGALTDLSGASVYGDYARLAAGGTVVMADVGSLPPAAASQATHAGCLAIELSSGGERIFVNCGTPSDVFSDEGREWAQVARKTAAHSTLSVENMSSARTARSARLKSLTDNCLIDGPGKVKCETDTTDDGRIWFNAEHDGYQSNFNVSHRRAVSLAGHGRTVEGEDVLVSSASAKTARRIALRFHLGPGCHAKNATSSTSGSADIHSVIIRTPGGKSWSFTCETHPVTIEESVFLAAPGGLLNTQQLVIKAKVKPGDSILWSLKL